jgi:hypothetical protein
MRQIENCIYLKADIIFDLASSSLVTLKIYDLVGREVATLASTRFSAGHHVVPWTPVNLSSGVYFYRLQIGNNYSTKKLFLIK